MAEPSAGVGVERGPRRPVAGRAPGPWVLALRGLRRDRTALAFALLFAVLCLAVLAAPLYAS